MHFSATKIWLTDLSSSQEHTLILNTIKKKISVKIFFAINQFKTMQCFCQWKTILQKNVFIEWPTFFINNYEVHTISFRTFFVWALLLIVHTWNSSPLWSNLLRLQCTCCTIPTTSGRPHGSPLVWARQWPSSQLLPSHQLCHNDSFWA